MSHFVGKPTMWFLVQQEFGRFSMDLVIGYKVFFLIDSCSIGIVFQESG